MIVLNFAHPLTPAHLERIQSLTGEEVEDVIEVKTHFDNNQSFGPQLATLLKGTSLTPEQWQTSPLLINPPAYNYVALMLLAELHGRMGYFPACLRLRPVAGSNPPRFEVAEIINLQSVRDTARRLRR
jgi:hypothetical protein